MSILDSTSTRPQESNIVLGTASVETQGTPISSGEPLGHDKVLGIASVETQGFAVGMDEPLGRDWPGMSDR
ncbi:hypothetical protein [Luteimonas mephitis]|uniref:hypothetical protein n=1 Tax=Luteimonas mephitis TaxID=83615 RepID=UPI003A8CF4B6